MKRVDKILVPIDFSEISERIVRVAVFFAQQYMAEITILFVVEDIFSYSGLSLIDEPIARLGIDRLDTSEQRMESFLAKHLADSPVAYRSKILQGEVAEEIIQFAKANGFDLIIMGTHGYRGVEKMLIGSITSKILRLAPCPVLSLR